MSASFSFEGNHLRFIISSFHIFESGSHRTSHTSITSFDEIPMNVPTRFKDLISSFMLLAVTLENENLESVVTFS